MPFLRGTLADSQLPNNSSANSPIKPAPGAQRLQISCQMQASDLPAFYQVCGGYIDLIQSAGLYLLLSGWRADGDIVSFFNYWSVEPDATKLIEAEYNLPDSPFYAGFADLFLEEIKDLAVPIETFRRPPADGVQGTNYLYMHATYRVRLADLNEFSALVDANLMAFAHQYGWFLGDSYLGNTGSSTTVNQMWIIPSSDAGSAAQKLARARWRTIAFQTPEYSVLEPAPNDPIFGTDPRPISQPPGQRLLNDYKTLFINP
jgi:hypothetical protein